MMPIEHFAIVNTNVIDQDKCFIGFSVVLILKHPNGKIMIKCLKLLPFELKVALSHVSHRCMLMTFPRRMSYVHLLRWLRFITS
jgi:hypothetical protein